MDTNLLYRFFNGEASLEEKTRIKEWFDADPSNRERFFRERKMFDALMLNAGTTSPAYEEESLNSAVKRRRLLLNVMKVAAVLVLAVSLSLVVSDLHFKNLSRLSYQTVSVPAGQRLNLVLPDGTDVWLNSGTSISYPSVFSDDSRTVTLDGEGYFDVTHEAGRPFIVHTSRYDVEVLGTVFNVDAYSENDSFSASLLQGSVRIVSADGAASGQEDILLNPSEEAYLSEGKLSVREFSPENRVSWKDGLLVFRDKCLEEIAGDLSKFYGVSIKIADPDRYSQLYTGKFRQGDGVEYALGILQRSMGFQYDVDESAGIIFIR